MVPKAAPTLPDNQLPAPIPSAAPAPTLWDALTDAAPELAVARTTPDLPRELSAYPGFLQWATSEFALGNHPRRVAAKLDEIINQQLADGEQPWPVMNQSSLTTLRHELEPQWRPLQTDLAKRIENVSVLNKNNRLLALARLAEDLEHKMFDEEERNFKTGKRHLIPEYRAVLRQISEEKGELGDTDQTAESRLLGIAEALASAIRVQGSGVQPTTAEAFDYYPPAIEGEFEEVDD